MITFIVNFDLPESVTLDEARERSQDTAPKYRSVPGLIRKHYLFSQAPHKSGGAYRFETREQAKALFNSEWLERIRQTYGSELTLTYFESPVVVGNVAGKIIS
ncbi:MAG: YdhR family protein [Rhodospirillaceae bacterium]